MHYHLSIPNSYFIKTAKESLREQCGTSILKVLHGNIKSPTCCMYSWRYNILLEVKEGIRPSFKGGYSDFFFLHLTELENIFITKIHMKKRYKSFVINPSPHMPILGSCYSAASKDIMSKMLTNENTVF